MYWRLQEDVLSSHDIERLVTFIRGTKRFTQFDQVREFEEAFSRWQGCRHSVFVNSGSSANLLLVNALKELRGWSDGDEILVPAVTWPTTVTPVIQCGLKPVFVDVNLTDLSFAYDEIPRLVSDRTRGIFIAHLLGFPANVERIRAMVKSRDITLFEDACESQGATRNGQKVGSLSTAGTFSFYWGHHMTTIEGGMVCTDDDDLFKLLVLKRSHGLARELPESEHESVKALHPGMDFRFLFLTDGFNFRNTEFGAVLGLTQLERVDEFIRIRNRNYREFLSICRQCDDLLVLDVDGLSSFTLPFIFRTRQVKERVAAAIHAAGIESRPIISGNLLAQPFLQSYRRPDSSLVNAELLHHNAFYIGNNQFVNLDRLERLAELLLGLFGTNS